MKTYFQFLKSCLHSDKKLSRFSLWILLALVCQIVIILSFQISYKEIFDAVNQRMDFRVVRTWIYVILTASVLRVLMSMLADNLIGRATLKIFSGLRRQLMHHLQWLPVRFYQETKMGDLISRYSHDLQHSEMVTRDFFPALLRSILLGVSSLCILFYFEWRLALFASCVFPFGIFGARLFSKQASNATQRNQLANAELSSMIEEVATQHLLVQAFNLQERFEGKFEDKLRRYAKDFLKGFFLRGMVSRTTIFGQAISEVLVFSLGAIMTYHGEMTIGTLFVFFALVWNLSSAVNIISQYLPNFIQAGAGMDRIQSLLSKKMQEPVRTVDKKNRESFGSLTQSIRFQDISLSHSNDKPILKKINLEIPIGRSVAFVGPTGSGKSTILSLLMGFHYPSSGTLTLDGQNIEEISPTSLRSHIGVVFQQCPLFNTTIRENIRMGRLDATDGEVEEAAKAAEIHDFIMSLPSGYDTLVLEYGSNLSGGQKQRLAIARVCLRNPSVILLDEPTSGLDLIIEEQINSLIAKLAKKKTVILATHRLTALLDIDTIYVIDKGEIIEQGSHQELLQKKGLYSQLWQKQHGVALDREVKKPKVEVGLLRSIPLLSELPDPLLTKLAQEFFIECYDAGQTVFNQGSAGDKFYIIARGTVEVRNPQLQPEGSPIAVLKADDHFGETALLKESLRPTEVRARSHCIFLVLHSSKFLKIIETVANLREELEKKTSITQIT